jgi:hypothetical protein
VVRNFRQLGSCPSRLPLSQFWPYLREFCFLRWLPQYNYGARHPTFCFLNICLFVLFTVILVYAIPVIANTNTRLQFTGF